MRFCSMTAASKTILFACAIVVGSKCPLPAQQFLEPSPDSPLPVPFAFSSLELDAPGSRATSADETPATPFLDGIAPKYVDENNQLMDNSVVERLDDKAVEIDTICCPSGPIFDKYYYWGSGDPKTSSWIVGTGDSLGFFTFGNDDQETRTEGTLHSNIGANWHLVSGPRQTDLPPRIYDLFYHWHFQDQMTDRFSYEWGFRLGVFTDFEGSVRDGVRFPGHYVGYFQVNDCITLVGGIDYLDRDDIQVLPVGGVSLFLNDDFRIDLVFPQPRIAWRIGDQWMHLRGEFGGGNWAVERTTLTDDVVIYRDYRVLLGWQSADDKGRSKVFEIGYVFDRQLNYRSGVGNYKPRDTMMLRTVVEF